MLQTNHNFNFLLYSYSYIISLVFKHTWCYWCAHTSGCGICIQNCI